MKINPTIISIVSLLAWGITTVTSSCAGAYEIGVHYQFSSWAKEWGLGNALYSPLQNVGTDIGGFNGKPNQRVPRLYPEREPLVNGSPKWLNVWDTSTTGDVSAEVNMMKASGVDYILYLTEWARNTDPTLPNGFYGYGAELDAFIEVNKHRAPAQQVKFCLELASNHLDKGYSGRNDFLSVFRAKIQFAIDHFNIKDDAGNPLYYFREGKPVLSWWEGAAFLKEAVDNQSSGAELIGISQQMARDAGYAGIYWVDSANTIVDRSLNNAHNGNYVIGDFTTYQDIIAETGFNAETGFVYHGISGVYGQWMNYEGYGQAIQAYSAIWAGMINGAKNHANFKYFPLVSPGWDSRAIGEMDQPSAHDRSRSCDGAFDSYHNSDAQPYGCSLDNGMFSSMLLNAKTAIDQNPDTTGQMLVIGTWNDLDEGTYLIPTAGDHGAHASAVKNIFKPDTTSVRFGANTSFLYQNYPVGTMLYCSNGTFGGDPLQYTVKACYDGSGHKLADELEFFVVGERMIYFGANNSFNTQAFPPGTAVQCSYNVFGDPAPGYVKGCYDTSGNKLANEWDTFIVSQ